MKRLSIIVPVYNVENWLPRCLKSLYNQNIPEKEFEVIVVNDGSTDNSLNTAEEFAKDHTNMRIITRVNGGLSAARNTGLDNAKGDYVWFVDSDDWIEDNLLKDLIDICVGKKLDVLCFGLKLCQEDNTIVEYQIKDVSNGEVITGEEFVTSVGMPPAAWCAIYRREFLLKANLRFFEGILHEDEEFTPRAYIIAERIMYYNRIVYNYFQRSGSIMKSSNYERKADSLLLAADSLYDFYSKHNFVESAGKWLMSRVYFAYCQSLSRACKSKRPLGIYKNKPYYPLNIEVAKDKQEKVKYFLINISPLLYKYVYGLKDGCKR